MELLTKIPVSNQWKIFNLIKNKSAPILNYWTSWASTNTYFHKLSDISIDLEHAWHRIYTVPEAQGFTFLSTHVALMHHMVYFKYWQNDLILGTFWTILWYMTLQIWKGVCATLQSGRHTLSYPRDDLCVLKNQSHYYCRSGNFRVFRFTRSLEFAIFHFSLVAL